MPEPIVPPVAPSKPASDPNVSLDDVAGKDQAQPADAKKRDRSGEDRELAVDHDASSAAGQPPGGVGAIVKRTVISPSGPKKSIFSVSDSRLNALSTSVSQPSCGSVVR